MKRLRYVRFYLNPWRDIVRKLDEATLGKLFSAAVRYADTGEEPDLLDFARDSALQSAWLLLEAQIRRDMIFHGRDSSAE